MLLLQWKMEVIIRVILLPSHELPHATTIVHAIYIPAYQMA